MMFTMKAIYTHIHRMRPYTLLAAAVLTLAACTQDELNSPTEGIEGAYPLQIGSVSLTAEVSEEPWTRIGEKPDGSESVWNDGDRIGVRIAGSEETGVYKINVDDAGNVTVEPETPVYWKNTQTAEVTAWYPAEDGNVYLSRQDRDGLTYVLRGTGTGNHQSPVTLQFEHQLAKVRVVTKGTAEVWNMEINALPMDCAIEEGEITSVSPMTDRIPMRQTTYPDGTECWEANVVPGIEIKGFQITVPVDGSVGTYYGEWGSTVTPEAGKLSTITLAVHNAGTQTIDLANEDYEISSDGIYYFSGTAGHAIKVTGGNPNIYLEDAQINVSGDNAIDITGGSPTIHVMGENNEVSSGDGAGIYVAEGSTVTITGRDRSDVLTVTGNNGSSGIGGYVIDDSNHQSANSGNINIENVTLYAYSSSQSLRETVSPGIGSTGSATCQSITIDNAAVYAYGCGGTNWSAPAIGNGMDWVGNTASSTPTVTISNNSEVHAHRGERNGRSFADYIGRAGTSALPYSDVIATVDASSVVYKYTGDGNTPDE